MLTARDTLPALLTPGAQEQRLSELYASCFAFVLQLRGTAQLGGAALLRERIERMLGRAEREARARGYADEHVLDASFAVAALIDEAVQTSDWDGRGGWLDRPLQLERYDRTDAGEEFFVRLDALRARPAEHLEVLEVYYLCMMLGFEGRYRFQRQTELRLLAENTHDKIAREGGSVLAPNALPREAPLEIVRSSLPVWVAPLAALVLAVIVYAGLSLYVGHQAGEAAQSVYAGEAPPPPAAAEPLPDAPAEAEAAPSLAEPVLQGP